MRLGALLGPIVDASVTTALAEQARRYVGEGIESLWAAQAIGRGFMIHDPIMALTVAATVNDRVELGTAVVQLPLYHPMDLAHRVFSLQQLCGERLILGVGAGSTRNDFDVFGRDYNGRFRNFSSCVDQLRGIFAEGRLGDTALSPWPAVRGGPQLFLGSWGKGVKLAAESFDGWIASANYRTPEEVVSALGRYRQAGGGRAIVSTIMVTADTDLGELRARLDRFADAGFDDAVVMFQRGAPEPAEVRKLVSR